MGELRGFGISFDCESGAMRNWYIGKDGERRWADNDALVDESPRYTITEKGREAVAALKGKYAGRLPSVDEALASRAEDSDE